MLFRRFPQGLPRKDRFFAESLFMLWVGDSAVEKIDRRIGRAAEAFGVRDTATSGAVDGPAAHVEWPGWR